MPKMYKDGSEAIVVHPSQVHNAEARGWSLKEKATKTKTKTKTKEKEQEI